MCKSVTPGFRAWFLCLALAFLCPCPVWGLGSAPRGYAVGVRSLAVIAPDNARLSVMVWYPSMRPVSGYSSVGMWVMRAEKNVAPARLVAPAILFSHDMVDSNLAHHEIASSLASAGFIVIAPTHAGDNVENASAAYSAASLYHRPLQLRGALMAVLREPDFAGRIDAGRIGLLGFGSGALTALQLCGVDLDYGAYGAYCAENPGDAALCSGWAGLRLSRLGADIAEIRSRHGLRAFAPQLEQVRAVGLLSPGWLSLANKSELSRLLPPLAVLFAGQGGLYPPVQNGEEALGLFPRPLYESMDYQVLAAADHYALRSKCPPELGQITPELCGRLPERERARLGARRDAYFVSFFQAVLGQPLPAP